MTTISLRRESDWASLLQCLPADYEVLARRTRQLLPQYGNTKVASASALLRLLLLHGGAGVPLAQAVMIAGESGAQLSPMRLHMKMRRAAPFLQALVEALGPWSLEASSDAWGGLTLIHLASIDGRNAGRGSRAAVDVKVRIADLTVIDARPGFGTDMSGFDRLTFHAGELVVGDERYATQERIRHVLRFDADVLVRLGTTSLSLLDDQGRIVDVPALAPALGEAGVELPVHWRDGDVRRAGRLIGAPGCGLLLTTVSAERLSAKDCGALAALGERVSYRFASWKAASGMDRLANSREDTLIASLYAKMLLALLLERLGADTVEEIRTLGPRSRVQTEAQLATAGA